MTPLPPDVPGVLVASPAMATTVLRWAHAGYQHTLTKPGVSRAARIFARLTLAIWWPMWPLLYATQRYALNRKTARYYLSADRTAILAVVARQNAWNIEDYLSRNPGTGQGKRLAAALFPYLIAECDRQGVAVTLTTAIPQLAARYIAALPGLRDVGRALPRGRRLRRDAQIHRPDPPLR